MQPVRVLGMLEGPSADGDAFYSLPIERPCLISALQEVAYVLAYIVPGEGEVNQQLRGRLGQGD